MPEVRDADAIVIGAGIMGCSIAYELAKRSRSVIVLEKGFVGSEGSGRSGGAVRRHKRDPAELPLAIESVKIWEGMKEELEWDVEYRQDGLVFVVYDPDNLEAFRKGVEFEREAGLDTYFLSPDETRKLLPALSKTMPPLGASYCPTDGNANPLLVTKAIARAARRLGVRFREFQPLERLEVKSGRVTTAVTGKGEYRADTFFNAAGPWARVICNQVGLDFPLTVKRAQLAVTEPLPVVIKEVVAADTVSTYFRPAVTGGIHIGIPSDMVKDYDKSTTLKALKVAGQGIDQMFPFLKNANVIHTWAGLTDWTPDSVCILDKAPTLENFFLTGGFSGHGFCMGPIVGRLMAEWAVDGAPSMDLHGVRWSRFDDIVL